MSRILSMNYGPLGYPVLPEYPAPFFSGFRSQSRVEHLPLGCHVVYRGLSPYKQQPPSPQGRALLPFSKYPPYYPLFGVRLDHHSSAFRPPKPTEKSALEKPGNGNTTSQLYYSDRRRCTCNCPMTPPILPSKHPICTSDYYKWLLPSDRFSHSSDNLPIGLRLSSFTARPYPNVSRQSDENDKRPAPKRFQCPHCEKSFGKSSHLRDHIRTHTGDRPYRCQYCDKAFTQYSNLRTHTRIHTGERPFRCTHCSKSFTQAVTLRSHTRTHLGERSYHCKLCSKSFACFSGLKGHIRMHESSQGVTPETNIDTRVALSIKQEVLDDVLTHNEK